MPWPGLPARLSLVARPVAAVEKAGLADKCPISLLEVGLLELLEGRSFLVWQS